MKWLAHLLHVAELDAPPPAPRRDPIRETLRAAVETNAKAKVATSDTYERRVHAMIDELFLRMAPPRPGFRQGAPYDRR